MHRPPVSRILLVLAACTVSCGGRTTESTASEPDTGTVEASADTAPAPLCPPTAPTVLSACTPLGDTESLCTYGDDPLQACREIYTCTKDHTFEKAGPCTPLACPKGLADKAPCARDEAFAECGFASGLRCVCGGTEFRCKGPPADPRCPVLSPNAGTKCAVEGASCDYTIYAPGWFDAAPVGFVVDCKAGLWQWRRVGGGP